MEGLTDHQLPLELADVDVGDSGLDVADPVTEAENEVPDAIVGPRRARQVHVGADAETAALEAALEIPSAVMPAPVHAQHRVPVAGLRLSLERLAQVRQIQRRVE